jgi:Ran GTPase-activating protein (RanGAP) involved in mRNA processing and transport
MEIDMSSRGRMGHVRGFLEFFPAKFALTMNTEAAVITVGTVHDVVLGYCGGTVYEGNRRFQSFLKQYHLETRRVTRSCSAILDDAPDRFLQKLKNVRFDRRALDQWKSLDPPGRFLVHGWRGWLEEVPDEEALSRIINRMERDGMVSKKEPVNQSSSSELTLPVSKEWVKVQPKLNDTVETLDLNLHCYFGSGCGDSLATALAEKPEHTSTYTTLDLRRNKIGHVGAAAVARILLLSSALTTLDLSYNKIGDGGCITLGSAIKHNPTLRALRLYENYIAAPGCIALMNALKNNSTLRDLDLGGNVEIGEQGVAAIAEAIMHNSTLTTLELSSNKIGNVGVAVIANAIRNNSALTTLNLTFNQLEGAGASVVASALEGSTNLVELNLSHNSIGAAGALALADALQCNSSLMKLNLFCTRIGAAGASLVVSALKHNTTLVDLDLSDNDIGVATVATVADSLWSNRSLTTLRLSYNELGDAGASAMADVVRRCPGLRTLILRKNDIGDAGAVAMANAIKHNSSLMKLDLESNSIGLSGYCALADAIRHNSSLTSLNLFSNAREDTDAFENALQQNSTLTTLGLDVMFGFSMRSNMKKSLHQNSVLKSLYEHLQKPLAAQQTCLGIQWINQQKAFDDRPMPARFAMRAANVSMLYKILRASLADSCIAKLQASHEQRIPSGMRKRKLACP